MRVAPPEAAAYPNRVSAIRVIPAAGADRIIDTPGSRLAEVIVQLWLNAVPQEDIGVWTMALKPSVSTFRTAKPAQLAPRDRTALPRAEHEAGSGLVSSTDIGCVHTGGAFVPAEGDLLFQDLDGLPLGDAIEEVTFGVNGAKFCHVGIATEEDHGGPQVIEAFGAVVAIRSLSEFLARSKDNAGRPKVIVGRLKDPYRSLIPAAIRRARRLLGAPYDQSFLPENDRIYCSELVWKCFRDSAGKPLFELAPMTFKQPGSSEPMAIWKDYYAMLGVPLPEGVAGCNPGDLSRSKNINIVHVYGRPRGWTDETWLIFEMRSRLYSEPWAAR